MIKFRAMVKVPMLEEVNSMKNLEIGDGLCSAEGSFPRIDLYG